MRVTGPTPHRPCGQSEGRPSPRLGFLARQWVRSLQANSDTLPQPRAYVCPSPAAGQVSQAVGLLLAWIASRVTTILGFRKLSKTPRGVPGGFFPLLDNLSRRVVL